MIVLWSLIAIADRNAIFDYLEVRNPDAAVATDAKIGAHIDALHHFPDRGRTGRLRDTRELVILGTRYVAAYRVSEAAVIVLRLLDGAQRWPDVLE